MKYACGNMMVLSLPGNVQSVSCMGIMEIVYLNVQVVILQAILARFASFLILLISFLA